MAASVVILTILAWVRTTPNAARLADVLFASARAVTVNPLVCARTSTAPVVSMETLPRMEAVLLIFLTFAYAH